MSKTVYKTSDYEELLSVQNLLKENGIRFERKLNGSGSFFHNLIHLFCYRTMTSGIRRENEISYITVDDKDYQKACKLLDGFTMKTKEHR